MKQGLLDKLSRVERLRDIKRRIDEGQKFAAFDIAVWYDVSINVAYRDIKSLKEGGYIPKDWEFTRKER